MKFAKAISRKFFESFWFFALKRKEHVRRESRSGQRELALFSASRLAAQNDVKVAQTHSAKVWSTFLKVAGFGAEPHVGPYKPQFTAFILAQRRGTVKRRGWGSLDAENLAKVLTFIKRSI